MDNDNEKTVIEEKKDSDTRKYRLPFALCKAVGISIQEWWTPTDAWAALKKNGHTKNVEDAYAEYYNRFKLDLGKDTLDKDIKTLEEEQKREIKEETNTIVKAEPKRNAYDIVDWEPKNVRVHGEYIKAKPYFLREIWLNISKSGRNYYFSIDHNGQRYFVTIDNKTANDRHWFDWYDSIYWTKALKISANGYIYLNKKGYPTFTIKDLNNFERVLAQ